MLIDLLDGQHPVSVVINGDKDCERLRSFIADATEAIKAVSAKEEGEYYQELERGYSQDRI